MHHVYDKLKPYLRLLLGKQAWVLPILVHKQMSFGKPILTHAYLPNTPKAQNLLLCLLARVARATLGNYRCS